MRIQERAYRRHAMYLLLAGFSAAAALASVTVARADEADALRAEAAGLERAGATVSEQRRAALYELYALETQLGRAERRTEALRARVSELEAEEGAAKRRLGLARRAEAEAQERLGERLTALYVEGGVDPLAVLLGATSLDEALSALDGLERLAAEDDRIAAQVQETRAALRSALADVRSRAAEARDLAAAAEASTSSLLAARDSKAAYVDELERRASLNASEVRDLLASAAAAEQRSADIQSNQQAGGGAQEAHAGGSASTSAPAPTAAASPAPSGAGRTLTVDAVAYSLPGYTASGLPVGPGVVAVDPSVIPLGTKLYVPGYGPAIAADVGTAIKGLIIDLWFPTYAQAAAWGRKTVTITVYD